MKRTNYGKTFHVFETKEFGFGDSKTEIIRQYESFSENLRQSERVQNDLQALNALPESRYSFATRQDVGHRHVCEKHQVWSHIEKKYLLLPSLWSSSAIQW